MKKLLGVLALLSASIAPGVALAEEPEDNYSYRFDDDLLGADGLMPQAARIKVLDKKPRVTLIRPRGSFVPELLKSIEQI